MRIEIDVVEVDGKQFFSYNGKFFTFMQTVFQFDYGCSLTIMRGGAVFDRTDRVRTCGAHDATIAFCGLVNLARETLLTNDTDAYAFIPNHFQVGDKLIIESQAPFRPTLQDDGPREKWMLPLLQNKDATDWEEEVERYSARKRPA